MYINGEVIPLSWKEAWITPIHKKGRSGLDAGAYLLLSLWADAMENSLIEKEFDPQETEQQAGFLFGSYI